MGRKRTPGLYKRAGIWHIDKQVSGTRLRESAGTACLEEAERYLAKRLEDTRQAKVYGVRPERTFREAGKKFLAENRQKASLDRDATMLRQLDPFIGSLPLTQIHMGTLQKYVEMRQRQGCKARTINYALQVTRRILNLAAGVWIDEHGLTWLLSTPKIILLSERDARRPYPLSWEEQELFFKVLPPHLAEMALFAVNTGCRDGEVCKFHWSWEVALPELPGRSVFIIPGDYVKNREDRLVVLNDEAQSVIERARGRHPEYVFTYCGRPVTRMYNTAWMRARRETGISVRVHDMKHTLGRRLRAAGVSMEDCQDLLGHKSHRITSHYTVPEVEALLRASNRVCEKRRSGRPVTVLKRGMGCRNV